MILAEEIVDTKEIGSELFLDGDLDDLPWADRKMDEPNAETLEAMSEENLPVFDSVADLMKDLNDDGTK